MSYIASDWGDKAFCIVSVKDSATKAVTRKIESVPIIRRGRIYMVISRYIRFKISNGKEEEKYYGGYHEYFPTEQLAEIALERAELMDGLKPLFNYIGDRRLEELDIKSLRDLYTILLTPFETVDGEDGDG